MLGMIDIPEAPVISKDVENMMEAFDRAYRLRPTRADLLLVSPLRHGIDEDNVDEILAEVRSCHALSDKKLGATYLCNSVCDSYIENLLKLVYRKIEATKKKQ